MYVFPRFLIFLLFIPATGSSQMLHEIWRTDKVFHSPESVLFDAGTGLIYVTNINGTPAEKDGNGYLSKLRKDGSVIQLHWLTGLHAPKGMAVYNNRLYVADIDTLVEIDLQRGVIVKSHHAPGAVFLNDVAAASDGSIYVSDSRINKIFRLKKGRFTLWLEDSSFHRINGLFAEKKYLYAGSSLIQRIHRASKKITVMDTDCGGIDGLEKDKKGNFIFSNWAGLIFYSHNGNHSCLLDLRSEKINTADINFVKQSNLLLVPTFLDNRVIAYLLE